MSLSTAGDLITLALKTAGVIGVGQTPLAEDSNDALDVLNNLLARWQVNRWLVYQLSMLSKVGTGAASYTVGPGADFNTGTGSARPDKIDSVFVRDGSNVDTPLFPFMSREGYNRTIASKALTTGIPESFFYDPAITLTGTGTLYTYPLVSASYTLYIAVKAQLQKFASLATAIAMPRPYIDTMHWCLARDLQPIYRIPADPEIEKQANAALAAIFQSVAQVPTVTQPEPSRGSGVYAGRGEAS